MTTSKQARINVLFAPDYRNGLAYQRLLADGLRDLDVGVEFLSGYRRGLPLYRGVSDFKINVLHLHWPEAYFQKQNSLWDTLRKVRYPFDLALTARKCPLVLTAHNLLPHNRNSEPMVFQNIEKTVHASSAIFVHSEAAKSEFIDTFKLEPKKCIVIPYGDHGASMEPQIGRLKAREKLNVPLDKKICLVFGTISPYKGIDEIIKYWKDYDPGVFLIITGPIVSEKFAEALRALSKDVANVELRFEHRWLNDQELRDWLCAADCTLFNYRKIFTSGAAALARSFGVPLLIPNRLTTVDLDEPHPYVFRFCHINTDFFAVLKRALEVPPSYAAGREWREKTSWTKVARRTKEVYENVCKWSSLNQ